MVRSSCRNAPSKSSSVVLMLFPRFTAAPHEPAASRVATKRSCLPSPPRPSLAKRRRWPSAETTGAHWSAGVLTPGPRFTGAPKVCVAAAYGANQRSSLPRPPGRFEKK